MAKELARYGLKLLRKNGAGNVIINLKSSEITQIKFTKSKITNVMNWNSSSINLFAVFGKKIISTESKNFSKSGVEQLVRESVKFAKFAGENNNFFGITKGPRKYREIPNLYDAKILENDGVDIIKDAIDTCKNKGVERNDGIFQKITGKDYMVSSEGIEAEENGTALYLSMRSLLDKYATGHDVAVSRTLKGFDYRSAAENAAEIALASKNPKKGSSGKFDVVFSPLAAANIIERAGAAASVFEVEAGFSWFEGLKNKTVANKIVNLYDDGRIPEGLGSSKFDDEGTPTQRTAIIEDGVFRNFLTNTSYAIKCRTKSTGNAGLIAPHPSNIFLKPGKESHDELIGSVKKGLYITNLWYTRFQNYKTGDFSTIPRDGIFFIENGKIKYPVKEIRLSDNVLNILKNISALGNNQKQIRGWEVEIPVFTPSILVRNVNITRPDV